MRAFRLAYDGQPFHGFQRQPDVPTVEDALFEALCTLGVCEGEPARYSAAGRTDAGVSALAQTVAFECPGWLSPAALNAELPPEIRAWASAEVENFHATHDARSREYTYHLHAPDLDDERAREIATRLAGDHDFHNLTPDETGTRRQLDVDLARDGEYLVCVLRAGGFARQLVRRVVSLIREVGTGESAVSKVERVLATEPLDGPEGVPPAPARPLILTEVEYDLTFEVDGNAASTARDAFASRRVEHATAARVASSITHGIDR